MFKALISGFIIGLVAAAAAAFGIAPINHEYTQSVTRVTEAGRMETFVIRLPDDQLLSTTTAEDSEASVPPGVVLPYTISNTAMALDIYRLRDTNDKVIGLASRLAGAQSEDWVLYFAARGALYLSVRNRILDDAGSEQISGDIIDGSRLMAGQSGEFSLRARTIGDSRTIEIETASKRRAQ